MIIFPAIDLRAGQVVRLRQGDPQAQTVFDADPVTAALRWVGQGAQWLHVVNLDGAFTGSKLQPGSGPASQSTPAEVNLACLRRMRNAVAVPIQFSGGLRSLAAVQTALDAGATRAILGTVAATQPQIVLDALARFGAECIVVGIDARDGQVATHGWQSSSRLDATTLATEMGRAGVQRIIFTDIRRDGMLAGVDAVAMARLAQSAGVRVIASGGVASLDDIRALLAVEALGVEGVITGQAIYTGLLDLAEAIHLAERNSA